MAPPKRKLNNLPSRSGNKGPARPATSPKAEEDYFSDALKTPTPVAEEPDEESDASFEEEPEETEEAAPVAPAETDEPLQKPRVRREKTASGKVVTKPAATAVALHQPVTVNLDHRKLNKKQQEYVEANWKARNIGRPIDSFFKRQQEERRKKFGHGAVYLGADTDKMIVTIPMFGGHGPDAWKYPGCLPMEFIFGQDGFPLGLILQLVGKTGTCKSGMLAEFGRWFFMAGGGIKVKENETKFNPNWYRSILGDEFFDMMPLDRCKSVEDWQRHLTFSFKQDKRDMDGTTEKPGPGRTIPILYGIDSVMGKPSEETQEQIFGAVGKNGKRGTTGSGAAARGFPIEALKITRYMRAIPGELDEWPLAVVLINHLRVNKDEAGNVERQKSGGDQISFQESFELEMRKLGGHKKMIQCAEFDGIPVEISCEKSSFGPTHRRVRSRVLWWEEEDEATGKWEQITVWDWDWATIDLLHTLMHTDKGNPRLKQNLEDVGFHLGTVATGEIENLAWSKSVGHKKAEHAVPWSDLGALIREDPALMTKLRKALRIVERPRLAGDYLQQLDQLKEKLP